MFLILLTIIISVDLLIRKSQVFIRFKKPQNFCNTTLEFIIIRETQMLLLTLSFVFSRETRLKKRFSDIRIPKFFIDCKPYSLKQILQDSIYQAIQQ